MKFTPRLSHLVMRAAQGLTAVSLAVAMTACGGGDDNNSTPAPASQATTSLQVVSFGDSLSDVGTYAPNILLQFGGGRFTTNPGQVWTQEVATFYGGSLVAAQTGGFGATITNNPNGYGYAQGGALVTGEEGSGWAPNGQAALTVPVHDQVANYLALHGSFNGNQLVLIQGGANDIIVGATEIGADPTTATAVGTAVGTAAANLAGLVVQILQSGATHVAIANVPNLAETPATTLSADPAATGLVFNNLVTLFNSTLATTLTNAGVMNQVAFLDTQTWLHNELGTFQADGFTVSNTATACNLAQMGANAAAAGQPDPSALESSLFCSPQTLVAANADQTYMFADLVHPTTHLHQLFAAYAEGVINAKFSLK